MSNASRGHALERRTANELRAAGYAVARVRGSLGPADLLALPKFPLVGRPVLIQVKSGPEPLSHFGPEPWNEFWQLARDTDSVALLATHLTRGPRVTFQRITGPKDPLVRRRSPLGAPFFLAVLDPDAIVVEDPIPIEGEPA